MNRSRKRGESNQSTSHRNVNLKKMGLEDAVKKKTLKSRRPQRPVNSAERREKFKKKKTEPKNTECFYTNRKSCSSNRQEQDRKRVRICCKAEVHIIKKRIKALHDTISALKCRVHPRMAFPPLK